MTSGNPAHDQLEELDLYNTGRQYDHQDPGQIEDEYYEYNRYGRNRYTDPDEEMERHELDDE